MMTVTANYIASSNWDIDFELTKTMDWYIRWDILYVKHIGNSQYTEYYPCYSALDALEEQTIKHPVSIFIDDELISQ